MGLIILSKDSAISLRSIVLNGRDQYEKIATKFYAPQNTPENTLLEKN